MSLVQDLMDNTPAWLSVLAADYKIKVTRDGRLASLKYDQLESPMHVPIVQECRGMVVDVEARRVLAWPYNKFWNHGEALAATIDWRTACVQEKLDGSLMILYWDPEDCCWSVASSGTPRASGDFGADSSRTFREAFWDSFRWLAMELPPPSHQGTSFMFEFCAAANRIVVRHDAPRLVLHGARHVESGLEADHRTLQDYGALCGWEVVRSFPINTIDGCLLAAAALDPLQAEGFVVVDAQFNRVKIKSPRYVALHHMKGEATPRRAIELWQSGETAELVAHFPEMAADILPVQQKLETAAARALADFEAHRGAPSRKEFALAVKDAPWAAVTFRLYGLGGSPDITTAKAIMRETSLATLERIAGVA